MKLLDVHTMNLHAIEEEDIVSVTVYFDGGDSWMDFADVAEAMNEFGSDAEVVETNIDKHGTLHILLAEKAAGQSATQEQDITTMPSKLAFLYGKRNEMMERAHYANLKRDSAVEMDYLKSGDRLYKAIRNSEERLRRVGAEVSRTDGDFPWYHITSAVIKLSGRIIAAYPEEKEIPMLEQNAVTMNGTPDADIIPGGVVMECLIIVRYFDRRNGLWHSYCQIPCSLEYATAFTQEHDDYEYLGVSNRGEFVYRVYIANAPSVLQ